MGVMAVGELQGFGLEVPTQFYDASYVDPSAVPGVRSAFADSAVNWELPSYHQFPSLPAGFDPRTAWSWYAEWAQPRWSGPGSELFGMGASGERPWWLNPAPLAGLALVGYALLPKGAPTPRLRNPGGRKRRRRSRARRARRARR